MLCDLHIHTSYSYDGLDSPQKIVKTALSKNLNCICITDHNETKGAVEALRFAFDKSILIIPGIEIKSKEGDILGINVKEKIENNLSAKETIKKIEKLGGMAVFAHPFGFLCNFKGNLKQLTDEYRDFSLGIEVLNASVVGNGNEKALSFAQKSNLFFTAGSDAHNAQFVGKVYLEIKKDNLSENEILEEIKKRNVSLGGKSGDFLEKINDHLKRSFAKLNHL
ncbi:MAG TPA: CehA/McbA family metallohydrolase [Candidatus Pacearchaeota archaeon]|nr:CehA/McbA family metallohydrolase [Candidatus Pacearchaeota archaeon]HOK94304.1 CehA/McbA family metallohydrolase [Candidatus Pacearchaeota archaeon]HPO75340.1 CehA/McbA family metallohydrolase [Candidatus Pacearchaeota archaeon]